MTMHNSGKESSSDSEGPPSTLELTVRQQSVSPPPNFDNSEFIPLEEESKATAIYCWNYNIM